MEIKSQEIYAYRKHERYKNSAENFPQYGKYRMAGVLEKTMGQKSISFGSLSLLDKLSGFLKYKITKKRLDMVSGINPTSKVISKNFITSINGLLNPNGVFAKVDIDKLDFNLDFSKAEFIKKFEDAIKGLHTNEKSLVANYFGMKIKYNMMGQSQVSGYPICVNNDINVSEITSENVKKIIEKLRPLVKKYTNDNKVIAIVDGAVNNRLSSELNGIIKVFPELLSIFGRRQHGLHDYTLDKHTLKVVQNIVNNKEFTSLNKNDKQVMLFTGLFHDIAKTEGVPDCRHAKNSALASQVILNKLNLATEKRKKIIELINSHEWYGDLNKLYARFGKNSLQMHTMMREYAFSMRYKNTFELAKLFTEADMKAVQKNNQFYIDYNWNLDLFSKKISELISEIKEKQFNK